MATPPRYFEKGAFYHVFNRGARKQNIFLNSRDFKRFLERMKDYKVKFGVRIHGYCLMSNHYHMLVEQLTEVPLSSFMLHLGTSYAKYFNLKYGEIGSPFQGRFKVKLILTDEYLLQVSRYIHRNPAEILFQTPGVRLESYPWSSYRAYLSSDSDEIVHSATILSYFKQINPREDYKSFSQQEINEETLSKIEDFISLRPLGLKAEKLQSEEAVF